MSGLIPPEGILIGFLLSLPAILGGFSGVVPLDTVLVRFLIAVVGASVAVNIVRSMFRSYAAHPGAAPERRRSSSSTPTDLERPGG